MDIQVVQVMHLIQRKRKTQNSWEIRVIGCHGTCEDYIKYQEEIRITADVFSNFATDEKIDKVLIGNMERRKRQRER